MPLRRRARALTRERFGEFQSGLFAERARQRLATLEGTAFEQHANNQLAQLHTNMQLSERHPQVMPEEDEGPGIFRIPGVKGLMEGGGTVLGGALDIIGRPAAMVSGAALAVQEGRPFWEGAVEGLRREHQDTNFATVLGNAGMNEGWQRNVLGFALDALLDPLNLLGIGVIRHAVGGVARGLGRGLGSVPVPLAGRTTGELAVRASEPIRRLTASMFSDRLGMGAGETAWHLRHAVRNLGSGPKKAIETIITADRHLKSIRRDRDKLGFDELLDSLTMQRKTDLMERAGLSESAAIEEAVGWVTALRGEEELVETLGRRMMILRDETKGMVGEVQSPYAMAEYALEMEGRLFRSESLPEGMEGMSTIARMVQSRWGRMPDGELGDLARLSEDWLGVVPVEEFYYHVYYPSTEMLQVSKKTMASELREHVDDFARQRGLETEAAIRAGAETNFLAVMARDIAQRRMSVEAAKIIDPALLDTMGYRVVRPKIADSGAKGGFRELDAAAQQRRLHAMDVDVDRALLEFQEETRGLVYGALDVGEGVIPAQARGDRIRAIVRKYTKPGRSKAAVEQQDALRNFLSNQPGPGEGLYNRGFDGLVLTDEQARQAGQLFGKGTQAAPTGEWILPEPLANAFSKFSDPYEMGGFLKALDAFNNMWKPTVTIFPLFVSFFTRNIAGLIQNLSLGGLPPWKQVEYGIEAGKLMKGGLGQRAGTVSLKLSSDGLKKVAARADEIARTRGITGEAALSEMGVRGDTWERNVGEWVREYQVDGGLYVGSRDVPVTQPDAGGWTGRWEAVRRTMLGEDPGGGQGLWGVVGRTVKQAKGEVIPADVRPMERMKALIAAYGDNAWQRHGFNFFAYGASWNQAQDNLARMTYGLWRMAEGDTVAEAARGAAKYIGDYTALGAATADIAAFVPFFRWTRFNVPLQVEGLIKRPYVASKLAMIGNKAEEEQLLAEGATLPEWVLDRHHVLFGRTPEGRLQLIRGIGLPIEDLNKIFARTKANTMQNILSELTPILRAPIEGAINYSFFTSEAIDDKNDMYGFYKRAEGWTKWPGISPVLGELLQVRREVNPETGRVSYLSENPMGMYIVSSLFGRFSQTVGKLQLTVENRDGWQAINLLTGLKYSTPFPDRPPLTTLNEALSASPFLQNLWEEYNRLPVFPQFGDVATSQKAVRALSDINAFRRVMRAALGREVPWLEAASAWGDVGEANIEGEVLARQVRLGGWREEGKGPRTAFLDAHPTLRAAIETSLSDHERNVALGLDIGSR